MQILNISKLRNGIGILKKQENITERRWQMGGWNKQGEEKNRVPDTAHDCPILRIGVVHDQPVSERENL